MSRLEELRPRYDVVVIGARAAGAATALLLARRGLRVLAVDRGAYGSDTLSTHALMRAGVLQLARLGVLGGVVDSSTPAVRRTVFHYDAETVDVPIKPKDGVPALFAPRRTLLDRLLVDAALEAGVSVRHHVRLVDLLRGATGRVEGVVLKDLDGDVRAVHAAFVVGADGLHSALAELVKPPVTRRGAHATATLYGYWSKLPVDGYHWYWTKGAAAGAIPTNGGQTLVFAGIDATTFAAEVRGGVLRGYLRILQRAAPELVPRLEHARLAGPLSGFPGHGGYLRRPWGPGWALVGDAGYFKDPITAHGISDALRDAELLANALARGQDAALAVYEAERDALSERFFDVTDRIASFRWELAELKGLHQSLSEEMKRETEALVKRGAAARGLALAS